MNDDQINDLVANAAKSTDKADSSDVLPPLNELCEEIMSSGNVESSNLDSVNNKDNRSQNLGGRTRFLVATGVACLLLVVGLGAVLLNNNATISSEEFNFAHSPIENSPEATGEILKVSTLKEFRSPSGNITCDISDSGAYCEISEKNWEIETSDVPQDCDNDFGHSVYLNNSGFPKFGCNSDVRFINQNISTLEYGDSVTTGDITCLSARSGIRCQNLSDRSFIMARNTYPWATGQVQEYEGTFFSPSKNITCSIDSEFGATCSIGEKNWEIFTADIPKDGPNTQELCQFDYDNIVDLSQDGISSFGCVSDVWWDLESDKVLRYGDSFKANNVTCLSSHTGLHCDHKSEDGFVMAKNTYPFATGTTEFRDSLESPSSNINCTSSVESIGCNIGDKSWEIKTLDIPENCENDYENHVGLGADSEAEFWCVSDLWWDSDAETLDYGDTAQMPGGIECLSSLSGVHCSNKAGDKLTMSRKTYPLD